MLGMSVFLSLNGSMLLQIKSFKSLLKNVVAKNFYSTRSKMKRVILGPLSIEMPSYMKMPYLCKMVTLSLQNRYFLL